MSMPRRHFALTLVATAMTVAAASETEPALAERADVCVLGGGAAGTLAALRLQDAGVNVRLLESEARLGGNCYAYHAEDGQVEMPLGVVIHPNNSIIQEVYGRFGVELAPLDLGISSAGNPAGSPGIDFATGEIIFTDYFPATLARAGTTRRLLFSSQPGGDALAAAFQRLFSFSDKYEFYRNFVTFPDEIPPELLVPFEDLVEEYQLQIIYPYIRAICGGVPNPLKEPSYYIFAVVLPYIDLLFEQGVQPRPGCHILYQKLEAHLRNVTIFNAYVDGAIRPPDQDATIRYSLGAGDSQPRSMDCGAIIVAFDQHVDSLAGFDLDEQEKEAFRHVKRAKYPSLAVRFKSNVPDDEFPTGNWWAVDPAREYLVPAEPYSYIVGKFQKVGEYWYANLHRWNSYRYPPKLTLQETKDAVVAELERVSKYVLPGSVEVVDAVHHDWAWQPSVESAASGIFAKWRALQGHRKTYHLGSVMSFDGHDVIWRHTDMIVEQLLSTLKKP